MRRRRLPLILQGEATECGLACLAMVAGYHGYDIDLLTLRQRYPTSLRGATLRSLVGIGRQLDLSTRAVKVELGDLAYLRMPCILHWDLNHFVVLHKVSLNLDGTLAAIHIHDPAGGARKVTADAVSALFTGVALELLPTPAFAPGSVRQKLRLRDFLRQTTGLRGALLQIFLLALALEAFALAAPLLMQAVIDGPISAGDPGLLTVCVAGFGLLLLLQTAFGVLRSWALLHLSTELNLQLLARVFAHLLHLPLSFFEKRHMGDIVSRFNSVHAIQDTLSTRFIEAFLDGLLAVSVLAVMFSYSTVLTGVVLAGVALYLLLRIVSFMAARRLTEQQLTCKAREQSIFFESVRGIQAIKLFNHENERHGQWHNAQAATINRKVAGQKLTLLFNTSSALLTGVENLLVVWMGASMVLQQGLTLGMLYAFLAFKILFSGRAYALVDKLQELRMLTLEAERLADIVLTPREDIERADTPLPPAQMLTIEVRKLSFRYSDADPWVIKDLDLFIQTGEAVAIVGASGCGKTTLLKLLIGILTPTSGEILVGGVPLERIGMRRYRELIGTVMQDDQLFAGTVAENISFFAQQPDFARIAQCARDAAVAADLDAMPMGYHTIVGDMGVSLSGGQKQRVLLARALYKSPQILFLDEATSHLDVANERRVNASVAHMRLTRILVAHRRETIASASRVVELAHGHIASDTENEVFA